MLAGSSGLAGVMAASLVFLVFALPLHLTLHVRVAKRDVAMVAVLLRVLALAELFVPHTEDGHHHHQNDNDGHDDQNPPPVEATATA